MAVAWRRKPPLCKGRWHGAAVTEGLMAQIKSKFHLACRRRAGPFARLGEHRSPRGRSFCAYKRNQNTLGAVPQDPLAAKPRLDTNDALASSVRRRRYALKVPAAHFYVGFSRNKIKITPYKRRLIPLREYEVFPGGGAPTRRGSRGPPRVTFGYFSS